MYRNNELNKRISKYEIYVRWITEYISVFNVSFIGFGK